MSLPIAIHTLYLIHEPVLDTLEMDSPHTVSFSTQYYECITIHHDILIFEHRENKDRIIFPMANIAAWMKETLQAI